MFELFSLNSLFCDGISVNQRLLCFKWVALEFKLVINAQSEITKQSSCLISSTLGFQIGLFFTPQNGIALGKLEIALARWFPRHY